MSTMRPEKDVSPAKTDITGDVCMLLLSSWGENSTSIWIRTFILIIAYSNSIFFCPYLLTRSSTKEYENWINKQIGQVSKMICVSAESRWAWFHISCYRKNFNILYREKKSVSKISEISLFFRDRRVCSNYCCNSEWQHYPSLCHLLQDGPESGAHKMNVALSPSTTLSICITLLFGTETRDSVATRRVLYKRRERLRSPLEKFCTHLEMAFWNMQKSLSHQKTDKSVDNELWRMDYASLV